jgi:hypothetical protein
MKEIISLISHFIILTFTPLPLLLFLLSSPLSPLQGIGCSVLFYLADLAFSDKTAPVLIEHSKDNYGIDGK